MTRAALSSVERSPKRYARIAGFIYLAIILLGLFGEVAVRGTLVVGGDAAATAANISASPLLWRAGIAGDLLMQVLDIPQIVIFYFLLRPVSESLALLAAFFNLIQTAVLALNKVTLMVPLLLLDSAASPGSLPVHDIEALSYLAIRLHDRGFAIGLLFFAFTCLILGYQIYKSGYLPKFLGVLMQLAGISYLVNTMVLILAPALMPSLFPGVFVLAFVGEASLCLWLIAKGVDVPRFEARLAIRP